MRCDRRETARRGTDHRAEPEPGPAGVGPRVRCHRHRRRAGRRTRRESSGADRRNRGRRRALECVGTGQSPAPPWRSPASARWSAAIGAPHGVECRINTVIFSNIGVRRRGVAGPRVHPRAAARRPGRPINPGRVFDYETDLDHVIDAYRAMDERRAIKSLIRVGSLWAAWTDDELRRIGDATELQLEPRGSAGTLGGLGPVLASPTPDELAMSEVIVVIGAGSIGQAIARRVSAAKHVVPGRPAPRERRRRGGGDARCGLRREHRDRRCLLARIRSRARRDSHDARRHHRASSTPPASHRARPRRRRSSRSTCTAPRSCSRSSETSSRAAAPAWSSRRSPGTDSAPSPPSRTPRWRRPRPTSC